MNLLLDTHVLLWYLNDGPISEKVRDLIDDDANDVYISLASFFEMAIKIRVGKLQADLKEISRLIDTFNFCRLNVEDEHCVVMAQLKIDNNHRDPFDALLAAQALSENLFLITNDGKLSRYGANIIAAS